MCQVQVSSPEVSSPSPQVASPSPKKWDSSPSPGLEYYISDHRVVASLSTIQLARERLSWSFEETEAVNRVDSIMASRSRFQARTGGSESVILCRHERVRKEQLTAGRHCRKLLSIFRLPG